MIKRINPATADQRPTPIGSIARLQCTTAFAMLRLIPVAAAAAVALALAACGGDQSATDTATQPRGAGQSAASSSNAPQIEPILIGSSGLSGETLTYPEGTAELRLVRVTLPAGAIVPLHTHPAPLIAYVASGEVRHNRGAQINTFKAGEAFIESEKGAEHTVENASQEPAVVFVAIASVEGLPTTVFADPGGNEK